jgi:5'-deoxynucleotidase YfbR-like HD superfamily hydrolase
MPVIQRQSVAEHGFHVAFLAVLAAEDLRRAGVEFDELKLVKMALLHDVEEGMVGDIVYPTKTNNPEIAQALHNTVNRMWAELTVGTSMDDPGFETFVFLSTAEHEDCLERSVMKLLDMLEFILVQKREIVMGNRSNVAQFKQGCGVVNGLLAKFRSSGLKMESITDIFAEASADA